MSFDDPISRMEASGTLTTAQAEALRQAVNPRSSALPVSRRPLPLGWLVGVAAIVLVMLLFYAGSGVETVATIEDVNKTINQSEGVAAMNRGASNLISGILLALPVLAALLYFVVLYNGLVKEEESVYGAWADVESTYQRRADLIPNLVNVVASFMKHERETLTAVTGQRSDIDAAIDQLAEQQRTASEAMAAAQPDDEAALRAVETSQRQLGRTLRGVMATVENYPALRSADQFMVLQAELEGTENRINVARMRFNESVRHFNGSIRKLPGSLVAGMGGFQRKAYFTAAAGHDEAVEVELQ